MHIEPYLGEEFGRGKSGAVNQSFTVFGYLAIVGCFHDFVHSLCQ